MSSVRQPKRFSQTLDALLRNLANTGRGRKQALAILTDALLAATCLWMAYTLRHGEPFSDLRSTWHLFVLLPLATALVYAALGIYRWTVRATSQRLFRQVVKGALLSGLVLVLLIFLLPPDRSNPRSLFVIYSLLLTVGSCSVRALWQGLFNTDRKGEPVAIYGAGQSGLRLAGLLSSGEEYRPVLFIDDDPGKVGLRLDDLPVVHGSAAHLAAELARREVGHVVLAIPSLSRRSFDEKLARFDRLGLPLKTMPSVRDIVTGSAAPGEIRDVSIGDILGRSEVLPDRSLIGRRVRDRVVLVTGGGGSIGSELVRQIALLEPRRLVVLDSSEENLYDITEEVRALHGFNGDRYVPCLASVRQRDRMDRLMAEHGIETVFHAAAYKHVPIIEAEPEEGVETNVFGTLALLRSALEHGVADFVLISTDKAVRPTNAMGATKRAAEMILQAHAHETSSMRISMVRFGNVLGSSGSVVPKFKRQILAGGPVTVTDRRITRYFMTIPEAAQLVLQASAIARGGDVFVLDMGEPVRIIDLAHTMIRLYGRTVRDDAHPDGEIEVVEDGLRPGEKMYEELFLTDTHRQTKIEKIYTADEAWLPWSELSPKLDTLRALGEAGRRDALREALLSLAGAPRPVDAARATIVSDASGAVNEHEARARSAEASRVVETS